MKPFFDKPRPLLFAHRGASFEAKENTMAAFSLAVRLGADVLELDVQLSQDGEVVVLHDDTLERTTGVYARVRTQPYRKLATLGIPRLRDVFAMFPDVGFNVDVKAADDLTIKAVMRALNQSALPIGSVLLTTENDDVMHHLENLARGLPLGLSKGQVRALYSDVLMQRDIREAFHNRSLQIPPRYFGIPLVNEKILLATRHAGIETHVWVINSYHQAEALFAQGVDGVMTDDPRIMVPLAKKFQARRI
jgi:glycerophosphoryl diester phosphodiesterase